MRGESAHGIIEGKSLFAVLVNHHYLLIKTDPFEFWHQRTEEDPYGVLTIMPPHAETIQRPETHLAVEKNLSVHRIDHVRVHPDWVEFADDGSVSYRLTPGSHDVEYREVIGATEEQNISFVTRKLVIEAGFLYTLNGYQVERQKIDDNE